MKRYIQLFCLLLASLLFVGSAFADELTDANAYAIDNFFLFICAVLVLFMYSFEWLIKLSRLASADIYRLLLCPVLSNMLEAGHGCYPGPACRCCQRFFGKITKFIKFNHLTTKQFPHSCCCRFWHDNCFSVGVSASLFSSLNADITKILNRSRVEDEIVVNGGICTSGQN
jgi:hypothetical protein